MRLLWGMKSYVIGPSGALSGFDWDIVGDAHIITFLARVRVVVIPGKKRGSASRL